MAACRTRLALSCRRSASERSTRCGTGCEAALQHLHGYFLRLTQTQRLTLISSLVPPQICREHDVVILEDDAYWWLQYPGGPVEAAQQPGLQLPPTFLSLDVDGRVLRIDTFSKLLGPG